MRLLTLLTPALVSLALTACSSVDIQPDKTDRFAAGNYHFYKWRTAPLTGRSRSSDPLYAIDPIMRREVDAQLRDKGYVLDTGRAQFTVDYLFATLLRDGAQMEQASNISPRPSVTPNRQVDQASVDNAIALGGVKETSNVVLQFNDLKSNEAVWSVTMTKVVENTNQVDSSDLEERLSRYLTRALAPLPPAGAAR